eukprot:2976693-Pyramimonas_sp.AAC.1
MTHDERRLARLNERDRAVEREIARGHRKHGDHLTAGVAVVHVGHLEPLVVVGQLGPLPGDNLDPPQGTREHIPGVGTNRRGLESVCQGSEPIAGD